MVLQKYEIDEIWNLVFIILIQCILIVDSDEIEYRMNSFNFVLILLVKKY